MNEENLNSTTDNPTEGQTEQATETRASVVSKMFADVSDSGSEIAGAGEDKGKDIKSESGKDGAAAPAGDGKAPEDGTTKTETDAGKPKFLKFAVDPESESFLRAKGILQDGKDSFEFNPVYKMYNELEKYKGEAGMALSTLNEQLKGLQVEKEVDEPLTRDSVFTKYKESVNEIKAANSILDRIEHGKATIEDLNVLREELTKQVDEIEKWKNDNLGKIQETEFAQKYNLVPKTSEKVTPAEATTKSNENVVKFLNDSERKNPDAIVNILSSVNFLAHRMAARAYPRMYNQGNTDQEKGENSNLAVRMLLAQDEDLTKSLIELGRSNLRAKTFDAELKTATEKASKEHYERGKSEVLKGIGGGSAGMRPNSSPLKNLVSNTGDRADIVKKMHEDITS